MIEFPDEASGDPPGESEGQAFFPFRRWKGRDGCGCASHTPRPITRRTGLDTRPALGSSVSIARGPFELGAVNVGRGGRYL